MTKIHTAKNYFSGFHLSEEYVNQIYVDTYNHIYSPFTGQSNEIEFGSFYFYYIIIKAILATSEMHEIHSNTYIFI